MGAAVVPIAGALIGAGATYYASRQKAEQKRKQDEELARQKAEQARMQDETNKLNLLAEQKRKQDEELARQKAEQERLRAEQEAKAREQAAALERQRQAAEKARKEAEFKSALDAMNQRANVKRTDEVVGEISETPEQAAQRKKKRVGYDATKVTGILGAAPTESKKLLGM